jgi:CRP-like cAMP-binding protein
MIGEIAFFLHMPRSASIIAATEDVRVLSLENQSDYLSLD